MIDLARARATTEGSPAEFHCADAQEYDFPQKAFDMAISRFGVMFFGDSVGAFANIGCAMEPGGALHAIVLHGARENGVMMTAERAAAPLLPALPPRKPDTPAPFAFADSDRVLGILWDSGWSEIAVEPLDIECSFPASALTAYVTRLGPLGIFLRQAGAAERERVDRKSTRLNSSH